MTVLIFWSRGGGSSSDNCTDILVHGRGSSSDNCTDILVQRRGQFLWQLYWYSGPGEVGVPLTAILIFWSIGGGSSSGNCTDILVQRRVEFLWQLYWYSGPEEGGVPLTTVLIFKSKLIKGDHWQIILTCWFKEGVIFSQPLVIPHVLQSGPNGPFLSDSTLELICNTVYLTFFVWDYIKPFLFDSVLNLFCLTIYSTFFVWQCIRPFLSDSVLDLFCLTMKLTISVWQWIKLFLSNSALHTCFLICMQNSCVRTTI